MPTFPRLKIDLSSQFSCDLAHELLSGALDLAIANQPPESPLLTSLQIARTPYYIGMSENDVLAQQPNVSIEDMDGRSWILFERRFHPPVYDAVLRLAEEKKGGSGYDSARHRP